MLNLTDAMDKIGQALETVPGLRVFDFPPKSAQPPFAFVDMPTNVSFDSTYMRGTDECTFRVYVGVAMVVDRSYRDALSDLLPLLKAALDATDVAACRCTSADFGPVQLASGTYAGAFFDVTVWE